MKMTEERIAQYKGVFVFAQQVDNQVSGIAYELLGKAKELAQPLNAQVTAVLIGSGVANLVDSLAQYGADRVIVVDDPELKEYRTALHQMAGNQAGWYRNYRILLRESCYGRHLWLVPHL